MTFLYSLLSNSTPHLQLFDCLSVASTDYYENINVNSYSLLSIRIMVIGFLIGMVFAGFAGVFNKRVLGEIVRKILNSDALSLENAMTLEELGLESSFLARFAVRKSTSLRRVLKCREEQKFEAAQKQKYTEYTEAKKKHKKIAKFKESVYKINPYADAFYIPEELKSTASAKFEKKGNSWISVIIFTIFAIIFSVIIWFAIPHILAFINELVGTMGTQYI